MRKIFFLSSMFLVYGILFISYAYAGGGKGEAIPTTLHEEEKVIVVPPSDTPSIKKPCEPKKRVSQTFSGGFGFVLPTMVGSFCGTVGGLGGGGVMMPSTTSQRIDIDLDECE